MPSASNKLERHEIHLLVIDDDDRIRSLLKTYLGKQGFRVSVARNAAEARHLMTRLEYDMLIVDVMMPGEDGFSLTRALREKGNVPILSLIHI